MDLEKMRARVEEIAARIEELKGVEDVTAENVAEIESLHEEFGTLKGKIEAKEKLESMSASINTGTRKTSAPKAAKEIEVRPSRKEKLGGFNNFGDFLQAVRTSSTGRIDERFRNAMFERSGEEGGFLVPDEMVEDVQKKIQSDESLLSRARSFNVSGNNLSLRVDETQPWNGGVKAYWTDEGQPITQSAHKFKKVDWRLNKLAALVTTSDELLEDAVALESYIRQMAPDAIVHELNKAILTGNGVGKPKGIINSPFRVTVPKEAGQAADTVKAANVIRMYSRLLPQSRQNGVWLINAEVEEQLRLMEAPDGQYIYLTPGSQMNQSPYATLLGRPVIPLLGGMPQLGDEGDIMFVDMSYYYAILKSSGIRNAVSTHLYFDRDQTAYKFIFRVDGACPFQSPVQIENGDHEMSGFVTLADRA